MPVAFKVQPVRFVNVEPGLLPLTPSGPVPAVIVSFETGEDQRIEDKAIGIADARKMVFELLESLATFGDPLAQAIGEQFFNAGPPSGQDIDESENPEYEDGCNDCGG